MDFPAALTSAVDGVTEIVAAHLNNLEDKVGVDGSEVTSSLDYLLKHSSSIDPGHKHTVGAFTALAAGDILYASALDTLAVLNKAVADNVLLSGDAPSWGKVSLAAMADMATGALLGRNTAGAGIPEVITDIPTAITIGGAYVYRAGGTDVAVGDGGTGLSAYTAGDILYASAEATLAKLAKTATGNVLLSGDSPSWGKVGLTTHISGVLAVANGGTGEADAWTTAQDPGHKHSKLWASDGDPEAVTVDAAGNVTVGASAVGDSAAKVVGVALGTAPSTFPSDMFHMWAADIAAGNCAPHFATELGDVIKLYRQNHIEDAKADYTAGDLDTEAEVITAFNTTNGLINSLFAVLENLGLLATS